ncbi:SubName: Full=Uncharacterized protein {ECO:0000313/EMBL:CCA70506.1} [Serendipita indica DSM 11827]|uniref:Uncharacterized protein n=1 Tax=Serendipita indica (strain DSM 11827) TaxID=1109443 RepID=G4TGR3_SERID|nr:SubName: Full=Uncharacterized protein {ECO:0000313/EMBL:CCA70506.1} [Serendipita indica DSM 11827]CCA70506.1 hypothetical protein PIIN_04443 [Serendipita indica DSM 11827]
MPLFKSSHATEPAVAPVNEAPPTRSRSIFSRRHPADPAVAPTTATSPTSKRTSVDGTTSPTTRTGLFGRRRRSSSSLSSSDTSSRRARKNHNAAAAGTAGATTGFFGGSRMKDPTLDAARGKVRAAELAEKEADKALMAARAAVVDARRHVEILEREANEQARLAQQKIAAARGIKSDAGHLGRHNH